jgi:hypothetical protein
VDGALVGQLTPVVEYTNDEGDPVQITGGRPASLTGRINLCSRSDENSTRYFDGQVAYLGTLYRWHPQLLHTCNSSLSNEDFFIIADFMYPSAPSIGQQTLKMPD